MIPLTFLYNEYIDWPKLFEQKTHLSIVPPHKWVRTNMQIYEIRNWSSQGMKREEEAKLIR